MYDRRVNRSFYQRYLLPGFVFQGLVIGGGYATGRELVEFFLPGGPVGGLMGMAVAAVIWSAVMAISFELCRQTRSYDYRHFFQRLLGRGWFVYEILLVFLMIVILSVVGAASGEIIYNLFQLPALAGTLFLLGITGVMVFYGSVLIERFMGAWSMLLYVCYATLVVWSLVRFGPAIEHTFATEGVNDGWLLNGVRYAGYNLAAVPMVFFCLRHITRRREALIAGALGGVIGMVPAVLLFISMMGIYGDLAEVAIPSAAILALLDARWFEVVFQVVLLGTLVQTGVGMIHGVNERIAATFADGGRTMPDILRPLVAVTLLLVAFTLASGFGLINLIAQGYGWLTFGFIAVFVIPVLTLGAYRVFTRATPAPVHSDSVGTGG